MAIFLLLVVCGLSVFVYVETFLLDSTLNAKSVSVFDNLEQCDADCESEYCHYHCSEYLYT